MSQIQDEYSHLPPEFNQIVDQYNDSIQKANQLRKTKNEEYKIATPETKPLIDEKYKPQLDALSSQLKQNHSQFSVLMNKYLSEYKENPHLETTLIFPPKLIGEFRKLIHDLADKFGLLHESLGSGAIRKLTVSKEFHDDQPRKKIKLDPKSKIPTKVIKKLEFPPDEVTNISVLSLNESEIKIKIDPPESYDNPIKSYGLYHATVQDPDPSKLLFKVENSNELMINLKENVSIMENEKCMKFKLSASNDYGESFLSSQFQILMNPPKKGKAFCSGSCQKNKIPCEALKLPAGTLNNPSFIEIPLSSNKTSLIKSHDTTLLLLDSGVLIQWGLSLVEETSEKTEDSITEIFSEPFLPSLQLIVHTISVGKDFCSLVSCLGEVYTWGYNQFGQLGHDDRIMRPEPAAIKFFKDTVIIDISCGNQHCLALDCDGTSYVWGRNQAVIGQTEILDRYGKINNYQNVGVHQFKPRVMKEVLGYYKIKKISSGGFHNAVLTEKSELYLWGDNESNQLGLKDLEALNITIPKQIEFFQINKYHIHEVSCGGLHTLALVEDSNGLINVWSWGDDTQGQCGSGKKKVVQYPEPVKEFEGKIIDKISAGSFHSLVLVKAEGLYGFGYNGNGEFGMKTQKKKIRKPMKIEGVPEGKILDVSAGFEISCLTFV